MVAAVMVNVPLVVVLVPSWGAVGAALATFVGNAVAANNNILWLSQMTGHRWWDFHAIRGVSFIVSRRSPAIVEGSAPTPFSQVLRPTCRAR